jgi:pilus assembly protein TadC
MTTEEPKNGFKEKARYEFKQLITIFAYLAFFFCTLTTYSMTLLKDYHSVYLNYGDALLKALVFAKVILIGEAFHLGKNQEGRPLLPIAVMKAFLYTLLVAAFHVLEQLVVRLVHGHELIGQFSDAKAVDVLARAFLVFCVFIPFFAFRELGRVLGEDEFYAILFGKRTAQSQ